MDQLHDYITFLRAESTKSHTNPRMHLIAVFSVLYFISKLFLYYPFKSSSTRKLSKALTGNVIAHRGSRDEGLPENTIAAFKDSVIAGTNIVELDVWLTVDGHVVVHHDESLTRMTSGSCDAKIHQMSYADLPRIVPKSPQIERISSIANHATTNRSEWERIPTLEEAMAIIPDHVGLIIEVKQNSDLLIDKVHAIIEKSGKERKSNVYWFSLTEPINIKLRLRDPAIPTINSVPGMLRILILYYLGILPFFSIPDAVFGITVERIDLEKVRGESSLKGLPDAIKRLIAFVLQGKPSGVMVAPGLFAHLRKRGVPVWFLGCATEEDLKVAVKSGATGVLTDRVNWLCKSLKHRGIIFHRIAQVSNDKKNI